MKGLACLGSVGSIEIALIHHKDGENGKRGSGGGRYQSAIRAEFGKGFHGIVRTAASGS